MARYNHEMSYNRVDNCNIAIIDDEKDLLYVYKRALELQGLKVVTFDDSLQALNELKEHHEKYCMVLVDIRMPKISGYQVVNEIKHLEPLIKIVLMSAYQVSDLDIIENLNNGIQIDIVMHKPFSLIKLINTVNTLLEKNTN